MYSQIGSLIIVHLSMFSMSNVLHNVPVNRISLELAPTNTLNVPLGVIQA